MARNTRFKKGVFRYRGNSDIVLKGNLTVDKTLTVTGASTLTGATTLTGAATFTAGAQSAAVARTATVDGLTTGVVAPGTRFVAVTSAAAGNIITLPAAVVGNVIEGFVGANGCELRTPAASGETINDVDSDGTNEAAIPVDTLFRCVCTKAGAWVLTATTKLGAVVTAIIPDAA